MNDIPKVKAELFPDPIPYEQEGLFSKSPMNMRNYFPNSQWEGGIITLILNEQAVISWIPNEQAELSLQPPMNTCIFSNNPLLYDFV
jgi:hypothetical protein